MTTNSPTSRKRSGPVRMRTLYDYFMGVLWLAVGLFFILHKRLGIEMPSEPLLDNLFGAIAILYGLFRFYRGYSLRNRAD